MREHVWESVTDDDFPYPVIASRVLDAVRDAGAGQAEMNGYADEEGTDKQWTVAVVDGPLAFAVHIDWRPQQVITATSGKSGPRFVEPFLARFGLKWGLFRRHRAPETTEAPDA